MVLGDLETAAVVMASQQVVVAKLVMEPACLQVGHLVNLKWSSAAFAAFGFGRLGWWRFGVAPRAQPRCPPASAYFRLRW